MLWKPRWLAGHALVIVLAVIFVLLGIWQLNRNTEKQDKVRKAKAQYAAPAPELTSLRTAPESGARVQVSGTYLPGKDVVLRDQSRNGQLGEEVLTPMRLADGTVVLVDRGWLSGGLTNSAPTITPAPSGPAMARGLVLKSRALSAQDTISEDNGQLSVPRVDTQHIAEKLGVGQMRDVWIETQSLDPAPTGDAPQLPVPPPPDQVNHMEYAIQWFAFTLIPLIGWPIVLWQITRRRSSKPPAEPSTEDEKLPVA